MGLDPTTEQRQIEELRRRQQVRDQAKKQYSQQTADQVGSSYGYQPWAQPGIHFSNAQVNADQTFQQQLLELTGQKAVTESDSNKPKKSSWWERNMYGKLKTVSRWTFAGMQTLPDLVQNAASDFFDAGPEEGGTGPFASISGWWKSTSLGSMMSDSTKSGSGFFAGEDFNKIQGERARRYRGEINGHAFTVGRKAAYSLGLEEGLLYNFLSGTIDAATNLAADPTNAIGKTIKVAKNARTAFEVTEETGSLAARVAAGLSADADELAWEQNKTVNWLRGNTRFKNLRDQLAQTKSVAAVMDAYGDRIPLEVAVIIADESDPKKIEALLVAAASKLGYSGNNFGVADDVLEANKTLFDALGKIAPGMAAQNLREIPGAKTPFRMLVQRKPLGQGGNKWLSQMPKDRVIIHGTAEQRVEAFRNISNALNTFGKNIDEATRADIIEKFARAYANGGARDFVEAQGAFNEFIRVLLGSKNVSDEVIEATIKGEGAQKERLRAYFIDKFGNHTDGDLFKGLHQAGLLDDDTVVAAMGGRPSSIDDIRFVGPTASIDFIDRVQILPDFKRINRLSKNPFMARALDSKVAKNVTTAGDILQNEIWKTTALMTMGYIMRNLLDGQLRYSLKFSGQGGKVRRILEGGPEERQAVGFFNAPLEFVKWAMHKTGRGTIAGEEFLLTDMTRAAGDEAIEAFAKQADNSLAVAMNDQTGVVDDFVRTGEFIPVQYSPENKDAFITGVSQQMERYRHDTISRMLVEGQSTTQIVDYLMSPAGKKQADELLENLDRGLEVTDSRGVVMRDPDSGQKVKVKVNIAKDRRQVLSLLVDHRYRPALEHFAKPSQGIDDLRMAFLTGRVGLDEYMPVQKNWFDNASKVPQGADDNMLRSGTMFEVDGPNGPEFWAIDEIVDSTGAGFQRVTSIDPRDPRANNLTYTVRKLSNEEAFIGARAEGSESLKNAIAKNAAEGRLPKSTIYENFAAKQTSKVDELLGGWRAVSRFFFNNVSAKAMMKLEKDPIFRQLYYKNVYENIDLLSPAEARRALDNIASSAAAAKTTPEKWATKGTIKRLEAQAASNSTATGTYRQLNEYAGRVAGFEMSDILFDAAGKKNIEDALRIAAPFGAAWREVFQKWAKLIAEDPAAVLRAQRAYNGLSEAGAVGGEGGFFYKDPVTGERMFTFPFSGEFTKLVTRGAINAPLAAPVKRLTMGFNVMPSIGPMGQIAASQILPDKPAFDEIRDVLLPYGETAPGLGFVMPGWLKKLDNVWSQNTIKSDTVYATTYIDVMRALSATGQYDLSTEEGKNQLMSDAKDKARWITIFRAASQFLGPTAGAPQYKLKLQGGDIYAGELVKEFQKLQSENYDTAVGKFLEMYGQEAELYISSKTKAKYGGLEATDEFGNFERDNEEFFNRHKEVAGYFAPEGSEFSFAAWDRQLRTGKRERLTDVEVIRTAQNAIGSYKYRQLRLMFGSYPSSEQRLWLKRQRSLLARQYPGFPEKAVFEVGKLEQFVTQLDQASQYPGIGDLPVTEAIRRYLEARDQAIEAASNAGADLSRSVAAQPLRDWLIAQANQLISEVPSFGRVFDRELAAEIED